MSAHGGELRLMKGILGDAIKNLFLASLDASVYYRNLTEAKKETRRWALQDAAWIASDDVVWIYSFLRICEYLNIEPRSFRSNIERAIRERKKPSMRNRVRWRCDPIITEQMRALREKETCQRRTT